MKTTTRTEFLAAAADVRRATAETIDASYGGTAKALRKAHAQERDALRRMFSAAGLKPPRIPRRPGSR